MSERLRIDDLEFELLRSPRRQTIGVTVDRGGELVLRAPVDSSLEAIERVARDKRLWVHSKLMAKERVPAAGRKEFVSGEGFFYLGRSYRLKLVDDPTSKRLRLYRGRFELRRDRADRGREIFISWYREHAGPWIEQRLDRWTPHVGAEPSQVEVRSLGNRWGSCTRQGKLLFHWRVILLPPTIVDYLLVHELVHLHEPRHSSDFWHRVEQAMPDYQQRRRWLVEHGSVFDL